MKNATVSCAFVVAMGVGILSQPASATPTIPNEIKEIVRERVAKGVTPSVVVGLLDASGETYFCHGKHSVENGSPVTEDSIYEIGSITKVFTSILMADLNNRGKLVFDDPVEKFLPAEVTVPSRNGKKITLVSLATHRSGLPRMPSNFDPADSTNPFADYTADRLYAFLTNHELIHDVGERFDYSNVGVGLLGHALTRVTGQPYETMVLDRICSPLGMASTAVTLSPELRTRLALGHHEGKVVPNWDLNCLAGAGAIRSSARDMLRFLAANLGLTDASIYSAMKRTHVRGTDSAGKAMSIGLGWHIRTSFGMPILWHNGGTGGYRAFCGFVAEKKTAVVVLSNADGQGMDDIGFQLLESHPGLMQDRTEVSLDKSVLQRYVGKYFLRPGAVFTVALEDGKLTVSMRGIGKNLMHPESQTKFFCKSRDVQTVFALDDNGGVSEMIFRDRGSEQKARRIK